MLLRLESGPVKLSSTLEGQWSVQLGESHRFWGCLWLADRQSDAELQGLWVSRAGGKVLTTVTLRHRLQGTEPVAHGTAPWRLQRVVYRTLGWASLWERDEKKDSLLLSKLLSQSVWLGCCEGSQLLCRVANAQL